ncbi:hypothetical protein IT411_02300 [Candidatus Peregrinibacteria bacterium]|nr:hypothetical protein [Candidatus Peregrinibacteria bacterium]
MEGEDKKFTLINGGKEVDPNAPWKWELKMVEIRLAIQNKIEMAKENRLSRPLVNDTVFIVVKAVGSRMISKVEATFATFNRHSFFIEAVRTHVDAQERNSPNAAIVMAFWLHAYEFKGRKIYETRIKEASITSPKPKAFQVVRAELPKEIITAIDEVATEIAQMDLNSVGEDNQDKPLDKGLREVLETEQASNDGKFKEDAKCEKPVSLVQAPMDQLVVEGKMEMDDQFALISDLPIDFSTRAWKTYSTNQTVRRIKVALEAVGVTTFRQLFVYIGAVRPNKKQFWQALDLLNDQVEKIDRKLKLGESSQAEFLRWMVNNKFLQNE